MQGESKMTTALIIAGGSGQRMQQNIPKQFLNVYDKPILIYTLEGFQKHPGIDTIVVVCLDGWHDVLRAYAKQFDITKLHAVVPGGETAQESIRNGIYALKELCAPEDTVIIHDGIRPIVDSSVLTDLLIKCAEHGNAVTSLPYNEQIFVADDDASTVEYIPRDRLRRVSTPQAYRFGKLFEVYERAFAENIGIHAGTYTNTLMVEMGERLYFSAGSEKNIKITTKDDLDTFKAYLKMEKDSWLK